MSPKEEVVSKSESVTGIQTHSLLDDGAEVSFLPASRMQKELVLLERKNLGRIIFDKVPGMNRGTKMQTKTWQVGPVLTSVLLVLPVAKCFL